MTVEINGIMFLVMCFLSGWAIADLLGMLRR